jgi:hypothetical protein
VVRKGKDLSLTARTFIEHLRGFWGTNQSE